MSLIYTYIFEAKSIQQYIFDTHKLRDIIGASEIIESLCSELLDDVLKELKLTEDINILFARRAGGAIIALFEDIEMRENFRILWTLSVRQFSPGLSFADALGKNEDVVESVNSARKQMTAQRNYQPAPLPQTGPLALRSSQTGQPGIIKENNEVIDQITLRKHDEKFREGRQLIKKFNLSEEQIWPSNLNKSNDIQDKGVSFPYTSEHSYLAILHADGNDLGQLLRSLDGHIKSQKLSKEEYVSLFRAFSNAIDTACQNAAHTAAKKHLLIEGNIVPARPVILGGDDLTMILRSDKALPFTETFLENFKLETKKLLSKLSKKHNIKSFSETDHISACAGLAFIKPNQPFYLAYNLAESLCEHAKTVSKQHKENNIAPASIAFHLITTSMIDDYESILDSELTVNQKHILTMQPYFIDELESNLPTIKSLREFVKALSSPLMANGPARRLLSAIYETPEMAEKIYERWRKSIQTQLKEKQDSKEIKVLTKIINKMDKTLKKLGIKSPDKTVFHNNKTPLLDAKTIISMESP